MADIAFDPFSLLDPARERLQVEAVNGPTFTNFSALDDALMRKQVETVASVGTIFNPFSHDPALAEQQMAAKVHGHGYAAKAVHFDGLAGLFCASPTGIDPTTVLMCVWVKNHYTAPPGGFFRANISLFQSDGSNVGTTVAQGPPPNFFEVIPSDPGVNNFADFRSANPSGIADDIWHCIQISIDSGQIAGSKICQVYVDDVVLPMTTNDASPSFAMGIFEPNLYIPDYYSGSGDFPTSLPPVCDMADFMMWTGIGFVDLSIVANRRSTISALGKPVNPATAVATFGTPAFWLSGDASANGFRRNQGSGGTFTLNGGSLTNASSSPSD